jgi:hypothetical protein
MELPAELLLQTPDGGLGCGNLDFGEFVALPKDKPVDSGSITASSCKCKDVGPKARVFF